jgi:hypothetical protein
MLPWYLVFVLPLFAALVGLGATSALRWTRRPALSAALTVGLCAVYLAGLWIWTAAPRDALRSRSFQPYRESVFLIRGTLDPFDPRQDRVLTVSFSDPPDYYDPRVRVVETTEELRVWLERADGEDLPLYVTLGRVPKATKVHPELTALVERADLFEPVAFLHGFEPRMSRKVYRYRPGSRALLDTGPRRRASETPSGDSGRPPGAGASGAEQREDEKPLPH